MAALQNVVNELKCKFANKIKDKYLESDYGIEICNNSYSDSINSNKLELIFLNNITYLQLNNSQLKKVSNKDYNNLCS